MAEQRIRAARIFTGEHWLYNHTVVIEDKRIVALVPNQDNNYDTHTLLPAFIDIQLYGAHDRLLAVYPDATTIHAIHNYCKAGGAGFFLPTVATNHDTVIRQCIDAVSAYWQEGGDGCIGLHIEGPWLHPKRRGAHIESIIHAPTMEEVQSLLTYGKGAIKMITLAPEVCDAAIINYIQSEGIIVSAGHSDADYATAIKAFDNGISTVTHLYNAMSPLQHRAPGLVGAVFNHPTVRASIIPDGHHVDYAAIRIAKKMMGSRLFAITDAVTTTTEGYYPHQPAGDKYESNGILSGSALTMHQCMLNLIHHVGIHEDEAIRMCSLYPASVLRMEDVLGKIEPGYTASFCFVDEDLQLIA
ncbi:MAG TPA: N-acetylglucosamine-6-phosphate deacetylase [Chitinophagaceae bacterium]|nr:N-acetylglucosamine-6-phosphate deacetylase [Chitinophagaceae bacterium]